MIKDITIYKGKKYTRYPESKDRVSRVYFQRSKKRLHRVIYEDNYGPIPKGWHIHHKDGDTLNNDISNLEAKKGSDHIKEHMLEKMRDKDFKEKVLMNLKIAQEEAKAWHSSPDGRKQHLKNGKILLSSSPLREKKYECTCVVCEKIYFIDQLQYNSPRKNIYCSRNCKATGRHRSGIDNEQRKCAWCSSTFTVNKYSKIKCCSVSCSSYLRESKN